MVRLEDDLNDRAREDSIEIAIAQPSPKVRKSESITLLVSKENNSILHQSLSEINPEILAQ
jgi:hypothetical protein